MIFRFGINERHILKEEIMQALVVGLFVFCTLGWIPILAICAGVSWIVSAIKNNERDGE